MAEIDEPDPEVLMDIEDDELGLLDDTPWDHHELDEAVDKEKSFD